MNVIYDAKRMRQTNTLPKMKNLAEYTVIGIHSLVWGTVLEISNKIAKKKINAK